jgi:ketosteroid isomerase-like protein
MKTLLLLAFTLTFSMLANAGHHAEGETAGHADPKAVVTAAYATFSSRNNDDWTALHTDDLRFTTFGQLPQSGVFIGPKAVIENVFAKIAIHWPTFKLTPISINAIGNTVYVHNKMTADGLDSETMHMFVVENGKVAAFTAFEDTDSMRQAMVTE